MIKIELTLIKKLINNFTLFTIKSPKVASNNQLMNDGLKKSREKTEKKRKNLSRADFFYLYELFTLTMQYLGVILNILNFTVIL